MLCFWGDSQALVALQHLRTIFSISILSAADPKYGECREPLAAAGRLYTFFKKNSPLEG